MLAIDLARDILSQVYELQTSVIEGVDLSTMHPDDGLIHAIADQIQDYVKQGMNNVK
jgi:hypothetical protein